MIVDKLTTILEFDAKGIQKAEAFKAAIGKVKEHSKEIVVSLTAAVSSVALFADRVSKSLTANYEWAKSMGVAIDSYQRFDSAARSVGGNLDDVKGDLESWVRSAKAAGMTLEEVFLKEASAIEGMTAEQSHAMLQARGYSETSIRLLQKGQTELKKVLNEAEVIPEENLKAAQDYAKTWRDVSAQVTILMNSAVSAALPLLKDILVAIREFVEKNKEIVKSQITQFFQSVALSLKAVYIIFLPLIKAVEWLVDVLDRLSGGFGTVMLLTPILTALLAGLAYTMIAKAVHAAISFGSTLIGLIPTIWGLVTATWAWTVALLANPAVQIGLAIVAVIAAIVAIVWVLVKYWDDIVQWFEEAWNWLSKIGKEIGGTIIGAIKKAWDWLLDKGAKIKNAINDIRDRLAEIGTAIVGALKKAWNWLADKGAKIKNTVLDVLKSVRERITNIISAAGEKVKSFFNYCFKSLSEFFSNLWNSISSVFSYGVEWVKGKIAGIWAWITDSVKSVSEKIVTPIWNKLKILVGKVTGLWRNMIAFISKKVLEPITKAWQKTKDFFSRAINYVKSFIKGVWSSIVDSFRSAVNAVLGALETALNFIVAGLNRIIKVLNKLPGVDIKAVENVELKLKQETASFRPPSSTAYASSAVYNNQKTVAYTDNRTFNISSAATKATGLAYRIKQLPPLEGSGVGGNFGVA